MLRSGRLFRDHMEDPNINPTADDSARSPNPESTPAEFQRFVVENLNSLREDVASITTRVEHLEANSDPPPLERIPREERLPREERVPRDHHRRNAPLPLQRERYEQEHQTTRLHHGYNHRLHPDELYPPPPGPRGRVPPVRYTDDYDDYEDDYLRYPVPPRRGKNYPVAPRGTHVRPWYDARDHPRQDTPPLPRQRPSRDYNRCHPPDELRPPPPLGRHYRAPPVRRDCVWDEYYDQYSVHHHAEDECEHSKVPIPLTNRVRETQSYPVPVHPPTHTPSPPRPDFTLGSIDSRTALPPKIIVLDVAVRTLTLLIDLNLTRLPRTYPFEIPVTAPEDKRRSIVPIKWQVYDVHVLRDIILTIIDRFSRSQPESCRMINPIFMKSSSHTPDPDLFSRTHVSTPIDFIIGGSESNTLGYRDPSFRVFPLLLLSSPAEVTLNPSQLTVWISPLADTRHRTDWSADYLHDILVACDVYITPPKPVPK